MIQTIKLLASTDALRYLFIGNYTVEAPPSTLVTDFHGFLRFAVDAGKLEENYKLYSEEELSRKSTVWDKLDKALKVSPFAAYLDPKTAVQFNLYTSKLDWRR